MKTYLINEIYVVTAVDEDDALAIFHKRESGVRVTVTREVIKI